MDSLLEFGFAGVMAGIALKALDLAAGAVKAKINGKGTDDNSGNCRVLEKLDVLQKSVTRLERKVIDGNGGEPLIVTMATVKQKLEDHVKDKGLHTKEV